MMRLYDSCEAHNCASRIVVATILKKMLNNSNLRLPEELILWPMLEMWIAFENGSVVREMHDAVATKNEET